MKPTLSYVRGLRDILEIPTREERRRYMINKERSDILKFGCLGFIPAITFGSIAATSGGLDVVPIFALPIIIGYPISMGYLLRDSYFYGSVEAILHVARAQQSHTKIRNRNPNDFPESKLALDDFPR